MSILSKIHRITNVGKGEVRKVSHGATVTPLVENLLRLGYLVRGLVYGVVGLLALQAVLGGGGAITDLQGAIRAMGKTSLGGLLLYGILAGLASYGLWGLIRAYFDPLHKGTDTEGIAERIGYAVSGISYLFLAYVTYSLITNKASSAQNGSQTAQIQKFTTDLLSKSWGVWVVGLLGMIIIGVGVIQIYRGAQPDFPQQYKPYALSRSQVKWIVRIGRFGAAARGLVFALIGLFLLSAAIYNDPRRAQGFEGVLKSLLNQPYGLWLLGVVALGLIAFGIYSALSGMWLRFRR